MNERIRAIIDGALAGEPVAVSDAFGAVMSEKVAERVDAIVPEVTVSLFDNPAGE